MRPDTIGVLLAIAGLAPLLLGIPLGGFADRYGPKAIFLVGTLCVVFGYGGLALLINPWSIALFFGVAMTGTTACIISSQAMLISVGPPDQTAYSLGWFGTVSASAQLIGPALAGVASDRFGIHAVFWGCALAGLLAYAFAPLLPRQAPLNRGASKDYTLTAGLALLRVGQMRHVIAVAFLILLAFDVRNTFFPLFLDSLGLTRTHIGLIFAAQALIAIGIRPVLGKLSSIWGSWPLLIAATALAVPAFFALPRVSSVVGITIVALVLGLTTGVT